MKRTASFLLALFMLFQVTVAAFGEDLVLIPFQKDICQVKGEARLVNDASAFPVKKIRHLVDAYNTAIDSLGENHPPVYLYFIESSRTHQIARTFDVDSPTYKYLTKHLHADGFDHLKYSTYKEFCNYFYSTDHHWNYKGSYQGYLDVVRMLLGEEEEVLKPTGVYETSRIFNGSYARHINKYVSKEKFALYVFDPFPAYTAIQNGRKKKFDRVDKYLQDRISWGRFDDHYGMCYGGDIGLLEQYSENHPERTLLIINNSQANAIKPLLTAHYGKVISVDLRHYRKEIGKKFSLGKAVEEYKPDQILLIGDLFLFRFGDDPLP